MWSQRTLSEAQRAQSFVPFVLRLVPLVTKIELEIYKA